MPSVRNAARPAGRTAVCAPAHSAPACAPSDRDRAWRHRAARRRRLDRLCGIQAPRPRRFGGPRRGRCAGLGCAPVHAAAHLLHDRFHRAVGGSRFRGEITIASRTIGPALPRASSSTSSVSGRGSAASALAADDRANGRRADTSLRRYLSKRRCSRGARSACGLACPHTDFRVGCFQRRHRPEGASPLPAGRGGALRLARLRSPLSRSAAAHGIQRRRRRRAQGRGP